MEIAIIAHDMKKELMAQFCIAYCGTLSKHNLCATAVTAKYISEATGLHIDRMMSGDQGGEEQIASRISYNEIDILLYFRGYKGVSRIGEEVFRYSGASYRQLLFGTQCSGLFRWLVLLYP